jgi:hypothetical protein
MSALAPVADDAPPLQPDHDENGRAERKRPLFHIRA